MLPAWFPFVDLRSYAMWGHPTDESCCTTPTCSCSAYWRHLLAFAGAAGARHYWVVTRSNSWSCSEPRPKALKARRMQVCTQPQFAGMHDVRGSRAVAGWVWPLITREHDPVLQAIAQSTRPVLFTSILPLPSVDPAWLKFVNYTKVIASALDSCPCSWPLLLAPVLAPAGLTHVGCMLLLCSEHRPS